MRYLQNLSLAKKFALIVCGLLMPLAAVVYMLVAQMNISIDFANKEIRGVAHSLPVRELMVQSIRWRALTDAAAHGDSVAAGALKDAQAAVKAAAEKVDASIQKYGDEMSTKEMWTKAKAAWGDKTDVAAQTQLISDSSNLLAHIGDASNLILDPDLDSFYLMDVMVAKLPGYFTDLADFQMKALDVAYSGKMTEDDKIELVAANGKIRAGIDGTLRSVDVAFENNAGLKPELDKIRNEFKAANETLLQLLTDKVVRSTTISAAPAEISEAGRNAADTAYALYDVDAPALDKLLAKRIAGFQTKKWEALTSVAVALCLVLALAYLISRQTARSVRRAVEVAKAVANGNLDNDIDTSARDEVGQLLGSMATMQSDLKARMEADKRIADENQRVRNALDNVSANVMIASNEGNLIYMNSSIRDMLRVAQEDIRTELPHFDVDKLDGANFDVFHKEPAHQRNMVQKLTSTHRATIEIGGRTFDLIASPVVDAQGQRLGTVVEWADRTDQVSAEEQVQGLIAAASEGKLDSRLEASRFNGFMQRLATGVNQMLDAIVGPLTVAADCVSKISRGDIPTPVNNTYDGAFAALTDNLNTCIGAINALVTDMNGLSQSAVAGQLDKRADVSKHQGDFRRIVAGVNATLDAIVSPLSVAAQNIERIARGDIPDTIRDKYEGAFANLIDNVNTCSTAVRALVSDTSMLASAAVEGRLSTRADATRHEGDFRRIVEGVNSAMDAIVLPIDETKQVMAALAQGDLSLRVNGDSRGDFAVLRDAVNTCTENLQKMVTQIRESSNSISTSASEISQGNQDLSARTEKQAASLEETASSMEELTGTVKQNADNARQANMLAANASKVAERGGTVVGNAISAMSEINAASKKIADIISVIDEIAFQTNLLALNAAVEAARAGEQGRGFAVVAAEVRNLAQRSAEAAKEIKGLIKDSVDKVEEGSRLVNETGTSLHEIVSSVKKVSDIIAEIAAASEEQSSGIEQINNAITQMDQAVQQNAALVEQAAAASESMSDQGEGLNQLMDFFKNESSAFATETAQPGKPERRSTSRPWSKPSTPAPSAPGPTKKAVGDDWQEF